MTSGFLLASSVSSARVSCGPLAAVVVTMPKSEKIADSLAPASSIARTSRRSETPVALHAATFQPRCLSRPTIAQAAAVLPESMQVPASATTGTPCMSIGGDGSSVFRPARAGMPMRSPRKGKLRTVPRTLQLNGAPTSGLAESQMPRTPPMFSTWIVSPGFREVGRCPE